MGQGHVLGGGRNTGSRKHEAAKSGKDLENLERGHVDALGIWVGVVFPFWVVGSRV